ncbi:MAG TPA: DUF4255 domain-containing protein [Burkholderiaceae bacterium]|nr:DUF4255 domain-containing protein [Burkholderiaceae bacterium]
MASVVALHSVTSGLAQFLSRAYQLAPISQVSCKFTPVGTSEFKKLDGQDTTCSIFVYRITHNEHLRNYRPVGRVLPLSVNLHLLFTIWADSALREQSLIAWLLRALHQQPVVDRSMLPSTAGFDVADHIQLLPEELSLDDMTKLWQTLAPPYRASLTYVARNVPIDVERNEDYPPVVATRFALDDEVSAP